MADCRVHVTRVHNCKPLSAKKNANTNAAVTRMKRLFLRMCKLTACLIHRQTSFSYLVFQRLKFVRVHALGKEREGVLNNLNQDLMGSRDKLVQLVSMCLQQHNFGPDSQAGQVRVRVNGGSNHGKTVTSQRVLRVTQLTWALSSTLYQSRKTTSTKQQKCNLFMGSVEKAYLLLPCHSGLSC